MRGQVVDRSVCTVVQRERAMDIGLDFVGAFAFVLLFFYKFFFFFYWFVPSLDMSTEGDGSKSWFADRQTDRQTDKTSLTLLLLLHGTTEVWAHGTSSTNSSVGIRLICLGHLT